MGWMKIVLTNLRSVPQIYLNWERKSPRGWSMGAVVLDLTGGSLSLVQIFIDTWAIDRKGLFYNLNLPKFALGIMSIVYDGVYLMQHYCLGYRKNNIEFKDTQDELKSILSHLSRKNSLETGALRKVSYRSNVKSDLLTNTDLNLMNSKTEEGDKKMRSRCIK